MRHLFVAAAFVVVALIITFGAASVLEGVATARKEGVTMPEPATALPADRTLPNKPRPTEQAKQVLFGRRTS